MANKRPSIELERVVIRDGIKASPPPAPQGTSLRAWFAGLALGNSELMQGIAPKDQPAEALRLADELLGALERPPRPASGSMAAPSDSQMKRWDAQVADVINAKERQQRVTVPAVKSRRKRTRTLPGLDPVSQRFTPPPPPPETPKRRPVMPPSPGSYSVVMSDQVDVVMPHRSSDTGADTYDHFIVLSGEAGAGKDSTADMLADRFGYVKVSLADEMKKFCMNVFGWTHDQLYGPSRLRNEPDPKWARPCDLCKASGIDPGLRGPNTSPVTHPCKVCNGTGKINDNSPRRVLQLLGSEWGRQMIHPDIWTRAIRPRVWEMLSTGTRIVISDARFDNDRFNMRNWFGAKLVDVQSQRTADDAAEWRQHISEQSRPTAGQLDYILRNDEDWPFPGLEQRVQQMLLKLYGNPGER